MGLLQGFDLNLLKTFESLMATRSVSESAKQLSLTQPAVSNALARLRRLLDDPLLVRTKQGMEPTPRALELLNPVKEALINLERALLPVNQFQPEVESRQFKIAAPDFIAVKLLSKLLPRWQEIAPKATIQMVHLGPDTPIKGIEEGDVDLAIGRFMDVPSRFKRQSLSREKLVCLLSAHHDVSESELSLSKFLKHRFIWVSNSGRRGMVDHWLDERKKSRSIDAVVSTYTSGALLVSESHYAMVIAESYGHYFSDRLGVKVLPLKFDPGSFSIDMLWHAHTEGDAALRWLRGEVERAFNEN